MAWTIVQSLLVERAPCFLGLDLVRVTERTCPHHARVEKLAVPVASPIVRLVRKLWPRASFNRTVANRSYRKVVAIVAENRGRTRAGVRATSVYRLGEQGAEHEHQKLCHRKERHRKQIQML
mgnify:CR=1 FL=1